MTQDKYAAANGHGRADQQPAGWQGEGQADSSAIAAAMGAAEMSETMSGLTDTEQNLNRTGVSEEIDDLNFLAMNDQE